jgi:hypothetical protein
MPDKHAYNKVNLAPEEAESQIHASSFLLVSIKEVQIYILKIRDCHTSHAHQDISRGNFSQSGVTIQLEHISIKSHSVIISTNN